MADSYIPLYRKYRPQTLADLVGQEAIVKTISNAFELNKIAHAYLFTGPRGTGKTSTARIFAKSLNCADGPTITPCGKCPSCIDITNGNAIDVIEIDAASNRKVEDARNLLEKVQFVPVAGKYKVYIIDEVHMLTTEAFNTLLKTLEEPPKNLVFILATTEAHKVLNTIISRCQRFDFRRIKQDAILNRLKEVCATENINIADNALSLIARRSGGGLRDALSLLDQASVLSSVQQEVSDKDILTLLGSLNLDSLIELVETIANKDSNSLLVKLNEIINLGSEPAQIIRELMTHFRNLLLVKTASSMEEISSLIDASEQYFDSLKTQSDKFEVTEITQIIERLSNFEKTIKTSSQQHLWLEVALISICHRYEISLVKNLEERILKLEEIIASGKGVPVYSPKPVSVEYAKPHVSHIKPANEVPQQIQEKGVIPPVQVAQTITAEPEIIVEAPLEKESEKVLEVNKQSSNQKQSDIPQSAPESGNIQKDWKGLLDNIESIPSRMFFYNLAKPVEITSNKIIITFNVESFCKQAQEKSKYGPFEKAVTKYFGNVPRIVMRTPLPEDNQIIKQHSSEVEGAKSEKKQQIASSQTHVKENYEQISQDLDEVTNSSNLKFTDAEEINCKIDDDDVSECVDAVNKEVLPLAISEQAKMIVDLFQGKVIE